MSERIAAAEHGGNLEAIAASCGVSAAKLLDFSANVNPLGPPDGVLRALREVADDRDDLMRYPEPTYRALRVALGAKHDIDPENIVIGNGSAALIDAAIAALDVRRALVTTPAFSEYRRALASRAATLVPAPLERARDFAFDIAAIAKTARDANADTVILNTPHNPSGTFLRGADARTIVTLLARESRNAIVDEAFVDYVEAESIVTVAPQTRSLIVVRSLTKFFATPALRVGFAVAHADIAKRMRAYLPSWSVTSLAARALAAGLDDRAYAERTRAQNAAARERLQTDLAVLGLRALPSCANYLLIELPVALHATTLTQRLIGEHGIVVRDCTNYDDLGDGRYVRIAVRSLADNARLVDALRGVALERTT